MSGKDSPAIGIDLGTTYSCVAIYRNGRPEIIVNNMGKRTTPSYVGFKDEEIVVGDMAKQSIRNFPNTFFGSKRLIGKKFNDRTVQNDIQNWPFQVVNKNGKPEFKLKINEQEKFYRPEKISSIILEKLKQAASLFMATEITKAVITVPAYFNNAQRQATEDAGKLAGLEVLRLLNEPTAAAISYVLDKNDDQLKYIMIFDLGGGTFDVSIIKSENRCVTVMAIDGDTHLGGEDFDNQLLNYLVQDIKEKHNIDVKNNKKSLARLRMQCENAKQELSFQSLSRIELDSFINGDDYDNEITKAKFEDLNEDLFKETLVIVQNCLNQVNMRPDEIHDVVLVGGSTRIPRIRELLKDFFDGKVLSHSINPDEAVALGAAIHAANLGEHESQIIENFVLQDVVPLTLGVETAGGLMSIFIKRNTPLPAIATKCFTTARNNQSSINLKIFEGERPLTIHNNLLGELKVTDIFPAPAGVPRIDETFTVDKNGILSVTAVERSSRKILNLVLDLNKGRLSEDEIKKIIEDAEISKTQDERHWRIINARNELESYCHKTLKLVHGAEMIDEDRDYITIQCNETLAGMAGSKNENEDQLSERLRNLKMDCETIIDTYKTS